MTYVGRDARSGPGMTKQHVAKTKKWQIRSWQSAGDDKKPRVGVAMAGEIWFFGHRPEK